MITKEKQRLISVTFGVVLALLVMTIMATCFANAVGFTRYPFAGFFFQPNLYVSFTERDNWQGMQSGIKPLYRLYKIDDELIVNGTQALKKIQKKNFGDNVNFVFQTKEGAKSFNIKLSTFTGKDLIVTFLMPFLISLFFVLTGFVVFILNPLKKTAFIHFISSLFVALFFSTGLDSNTSYWFYRLFVLYPFFGATAIHLVLSIAASNFLKKYPLTQSIPYLLAGIIVSFQEYYLYSIYSAKLIYMIAPLFLVGCVILNFVYLLFHYLTTSDFEKRRRTRIYMIALIFGTIIPSLWSISFVFNKPIIDLDYAILLSIFYPILTGYAITREDLFNLDSIVRTTLEYIVFTTVVICSYFIIAGTTSILLQKYVSESPIINTTITISVLVILLPLRKRIQDFVDKTFYSEKHNILENLDEVTKSLSYVRDRKTLGTILGKKLMKSLSIKDAGLLCSTIDGKSCIYYSPHSTTNLFISKHALTRIFAKTGVIEFFNNIATANPPVAMRKELTELKKLSPQYLLPIGKETTRGVLVLGEKVFEHSKYLHEDFHFLKNLYSQLEIALINAELHEQKAKQETLATIGEVASIIIHEIKNPLGIIKLSAGAIRKRIKEDPKTLEALGFIEDEVKRMNDTVTNFLDYAKPKNPIQRKYSIEEFKSYIENIQTITQKTGHYISLDISENIKTIFIDPDHLKQMLLNIVLNAREAMPAGGPINIEIKLIEDNIEISVIDAGIGIGQNVAKKIFEPFFTTKQHGTGLGLCVTKQLARANGGDIKWKKRAEGGTIFSIILPLENITREILV